MADLMTFPNTVEEFMEQYKIVDTEQVYTNGAELVPIFRMEQWFEHADFAPVVRCKDCKWYQEGYDIDGKWFTHCKNIRTYGQTNPDWFCGDGERRDDAEKAD